MGICRIVGNVRHPFIEKFTAAKFFKVYPLPAPFSGFTDRIAGIHWMSQFRPIHQLRKLIKRF